MGLFLKGRKCAKESVHPDEKRRGKASAVCLAASRRGQRETAPPARRKSSGKARSVPLPSVYVKGMHKTFPRDREEVIMTIGDTRFLQVVRGASAALAFTFIAGMAAPQVLGVRPQLRGVAPSD